MRPLTLSMTAFGPFPGTETINFAELGENPLFLINGPTGSGKTTLLDAICFALYGRTTGDEREAAQMRCDLAPADILTEVTLGFELSGRTFRIRRVPEQQRLKSRGEGTTTHAPEAQFYELADGGERLIVSSKVTEATREIENLTGLSVEQFRQVMVLPQGKFRQLLLAESHERERIFSQLFQTGIYKRLEEKLKEQSAEIRRERERQQQLRQGILEGAGVESAEALQLELLALEPETEQARQLKEEHERLCSAAVTTFQQAKALSEDFARLDDVSADLVKLQQQKERVDAGRQRLQLAELAAKLEPAIADRRRCEQELKQAQVALDSAGKLARETARQLEEAECQLADSQQLQTELDRARQDAGQLAGYRSRAERLAEARQTLEKATTGAETVELQLRYKLLTEQHALHLELDRLEQKILMQQRLLLAKKEEGAQLRQRHDELDQAAKMLELAWHQGQAAILAAELRAGEPCPVCGSREHPAPARSDQPLTTQQQVEQARQKVREANEALHLAREQFSEEQERLRELQQEQEKCRSRLGDAAGRSEIELKAEIDGLKAKSMERGMVLPDLRQLQAMDVQQLRTDAERAKSDAVAAKARADTAERELPEEFRQPGALDQAAGRVQRQIEELEKLIKQIAETYRKALGEAKAAQAGEQAAELQRLKTEQALENALAACRVALDNSPFSTEQNYQEALLAEDLFDSLKTQIADYDAKCQRIAGALHQLQMQLGSKERPDLQQFEVQLKNAEEQKQQAAGCWMQLDKRLSLLLTTRQNLQKAAATQAELDRQYTVIGTLSDVANGQTGNKISLQRFVLSVLLDDVLVEASHRLSLMSKGRYQLLRKEDRAKGNKASGLELEVEDAYTGKVRPVATLSGGESFMAALSMALGLSDVVQAYAGGIRLDTLFVDEGFGSLDAESMDLAIRTLIDLQATGRMVGIISHVAELKEQMPLRLDVMAGRDGSRVYLVVPCGIPSRLQSGKQ